MGLEEGGSDDENMENARYSCSPLIAFSVIYNSNNGTIRKK